MPYTNIYTQDFSAADSEDGYGQYLLNAGGDPVTGLTRVNAGSGADDKYIKAVMTEGNPPWWDSNHYYPGSGWLNLLMFAYFAAGGGVLPSVTDITNYRMTWRLRAKDLLVPAEARLVQWIQGHYPPSGVYYNYERIVGTIGEQLGFGSKGAGRRAHVQGVKDSGWVDCVTHFRPLDSEWQCMGSQPSRVGVPSNGNPALYGCAPSVRDLFGLSAGATKIDTGILAIWRNSPPYDTPPGKKIKGELWCSKVQLDSWAP